MFDLTILGVWISDETLIFLFDTIILGVSSNDYWVLLGIWRSTKTLLLVFDRLLRGL